MGKSKKKSEYRKKKRNFHGNQHTGLLESPQPGDKRPASPNNASFSKIRSPPPKRANVDNHQKPEGLRIIDASLLCEFLTTFPCPSCSGSLEAAESKFHGLVSELRVSCMSYSCDYHNSFHTSKRGGGKKRFFTVNRQYALAMFAIGRNRQQAVRFCANMDMPQPVALESWRGHLKAINKTTMNVAEVSMRRAAKGMKKANENILEVTVSCDGTWQKRGYSSKNGISTVLTVDDKNSKVIDTEVLTNYCNSCAQKKASLSNEDFTKWYDSHKPACFTNHTGSAGSMEPAGMEKIFRRSEKKRRLRYTGYLGDGDSKSFTMVASANPPIYAGKKIVKLECCGHIQKRMGKRLMDMVAKCKTKTYKVGSRTYKGIGGQGRLTQKAITRIQGHYGGAIRSNTGNLNAMKKSIMAIWKHRRRDHSDCGDWCRNLSDTKRDNNALPDYICDEIKPIFEHLSSDELLLKCLHGGTQNTNESFHNLIWERCPKTTFAGLTRLQLAVADATIAYNDGEYGRLLIFQVLGLSHGHHLQDGLVMIDQKRIQNAYVAGDKASMNARQRKSIESKKQKSDPTYSAGSF